MHSIIISNLFRPQHLSDAKKAQQNLESTFKHLESVSHVLLLLPVAETSHMFVRKIGIWQCR